MLVLGMKLMTDLPPCYPWVNLDLFSFLGVPMYLRGGVLCSEASYCGMEFGRIFFLYSYYFTFLVELVQFTEYPKDFWSFALNILFLSCL